MLGTINVLQEEDKCAATRYLGNSVSIQTKSIKN
jgi:hypothetical protein